MRHRLSRSQSPGASPRTGLRQMLVALCGAAALAAAGAVALFMPADVSLALVSTLLTGALLSIALLIGAIAYLDATRHHLQRRLLTTAGAWRNEHHRLRRALDGAQEGWWDWGADHGGVLVSARTREILGLGAQTPPDQVLSVWRERLHAQDRKRVHLALRRHIRDDVPLDLTCRVTLPDGAMRCLRLRGQALRNEAGKLISVSGFVADVTELQATDAAQACLAARHASVLAAMPDLMFEIDDDGRYLRFHASNEGDLAVPPAQLIGRHLSDVLPAGVVDGMEGAFRQVREQGGCALLSFALDTQQARAQVFEARVVGVETGGYLCIVRNITERKAAERELIRHRDNLAELVAEQTIDLLLAKEAAERVSRGQRDFLSTLSHELRAPLHAILGFAELAGTPEVTAARRTHCLERIEQSGERLLAMVSELLDVARHEAVRGQIQLTPVDWTLVCREVLDECEALLGAKHLTAHCDFSETVCPVRADGPRLRQVVMNLVNNAIKFSPDGSLLVLRLLDCVPGANGGPVVVLEVEDKGVGLAQGGVEHLFDAFVRVDEDNDDVASGSGLGLSICRQYVEVFGGEISARPAPGGGALFRVELPCAAAHNPVAELAA